jgi:hypothetical protein
MKRAINVLREYIMFENKKADLNIQICFFSGGE